MCKRLVSDALDSPAADLMRKDAQGISATRTIYHVLLRAPQTSEAISFRRRCTKACPDPTPCSLTPNSFFSFYQPPIGYCFLRDLPQRSVVGVLSAPPTALAQISSLRHGLLTPSVGFRQCLTRPSRGKWAAINHLPHSLSVSLEISGVEAVTWL